MKYLAVAFLIAISAVVSYAGPTPTVDPLLEARRKSNPKETKTPTPQLCAQKDLAFGDKTCTYVYMVNGDGATSKIVDTDCVILRTDPAPHDVSTSVKWDYQFRTCNVVKLNHVVRQKWAPTDRDYLMPLYQSEQDVHGLLQYGPSVNDHVDKRNACTLKYNDLPDGGWYAWICPFQCDC